MSGMFPELDDLRITVDPSTRERHLSAIGSALRSAQRPRRRRRYRLMAVAAAIVLLLPVIALAAERTGPGDLLYPVRQLFERVSGGDPFSDERRPVLDSRLEHETDDDSDRVTDGVRVDPETRAPGPVDSRPSDDTLHRDDRKADHQDDAISGERPGSDPSTTVTRDGDARGDDRTRSSDP